MFSIEAFHRCRCERSRDARTGADATSPRFVAVKLIDVERKGLQRDEAGGGQVCEPTPIDATTSSEGPLRIVCENQCLGCLCDRARQREPIEMSDQHRAA